MDHDLFRSVCIICVVVAAWRSRVHGELIRFQDMESQFPHVIRNVTDEEDAIIKKYYKDFVRPFVRVGEAGYLAMAGYGDHAAHIYNLAVRPDDIWVTSFSRSGTTWLQELVWLVANDLDFEAATNNTVHEQFAYIEYPTQRSEISKPPAPGGAGQPTATVEDFRTLPRVASPRHVKSHLPLSLLPPALLDTAKASADQPRWRTSGPCRASPPLATSSRTSRSRCCRRRCSTPPRQVPTSHGGGLQDPAARRLPSPRQVAPPALAAAAGAARHRQGKCRPATVEDFRTLPRVASPRHVKSHLPLSLLPPALLDTAKASADQPRWRTSGPCRASPPLATSSRTSRSRCCRRRCSTPPRQVPTSHGGGLQDPAARRLPSPRQVAPPALAAAAGAARHCQGKCRPATVEDFRTLPRVASPRYLKSHLPLSLLPPALLDTAKVLYIARDPRDVVVSFHFAHKLFRYFDDAVTLREFWDLFKRDLIMHTPLFPHVKEAWGRRDHPNLLFLFYEGLQRDLPGAIEQVCAFLGRTYSAEQKRRLADHLSFNNMKKKSMFKADKDTSNENTFFRKGQSGGWAQYFDEDMKREAEEYITKNLANTDMRYPQPK